MHGVQGLPPVLNRFPPLHHRPERRCGRSIAPGDRQIRGGHAVISQTHRISTALAVALATGAVAPAGASAMLPAPDPPPPHHRTIVLVRADSGFDWGDAGIGAAGALGLSMLAAGGIIVVTRRRPSGPTGAMS